MAVYTQASHKQIAEFIANYNIGDLQSFTAIHQGIQNSNYFIVTNVARFVLTIYENSIDYQDLPFFLNLLEHLKRNSIPCPSVIRDKLNNPIGQLNGKPCAITSFLHGSELAEIKNEHLAELGTNIAKFHIAGSSYEGQRSNALSLQGWKEMFVPIKHQVNKLQQNLAEEIESQLNFLQKNWPQNLPSGIIHADMFPDNVFFDNNRLVGIIDFYFACNDTLMYDLAICINSWCFEKNHVFNQEKVNLLISYYNKIRAISKHELDCLPILIQGAAMRFLLTRLSAWLEGLDKAIVTTKDPLEYLQKMRFWQTAKINFI